MVFHNRRKSFGGDALRKFRGIPNRPISKPHRSGEKPVRWNASPFASELLRTEHRQRFEESVRYQAESVKQAVEAVIHDGMAYAHVSFFAGPVGRGAMVALPSRYNLIGYNISSDDLNKLGVPIGIQSRLRDHDRVAYVIKTD